MGEQGGGNWEVDGAVGEEQDESLRCCSNVFHRGRTMASNSNDFKILKNINNLYLGSYLVIWGIY
jgi:hypothetical protein